MHSMFETYGERQRRRKAGLAAQKNAVTYLTKLDDFLKIQGIDPPAATADDLEAFVDSLSSYSPSTIKLAIVQVRAAYRYAHRRGVITQDPGVDLMAPRQPDEEPHTFTPNELRAILKAVPTFRHDCLVKLLMYAGLRRIETGRLSWADVDLPSQTLTVMGKGMKIRKVPIHPVLHDALAVWQPNSRCDWVCGTRRWGALSTDSFRRMMDTISEASGVEIKSHSFRKTLATDLYERGVRDDVLDQMFGWSKSSVRQRFYSRIAGEQMQQAILLAYKDLRLLG